MHVHILIVFFFSSLSLNKWDISVITKLSSTMGCWGNYWLENEILLAWMETARHDFITSCFFCCISLYCDIVKKYFFFHQLTFLLLDKLTLEKCFLPPPLHARIGERKKMLHLVRKLPFLNTTFKLSCAIVTESDLLIMCHYKEKSFTFYCILMQCLQHLCHQTHQLNEFMVIRTYKLQPLQKESCRWDLNSGVIEE